MKACLVPFTGLGTSNAIALATVLYSPNFSIVTVSDQHYTHFRVSTGLARIWTK